MKTPEEIEGKALERLTLARKATILLSIFIFEKIVNCSEASHLYLR